MTRMDDDYNALPRGNFGDRLVKARVLAREVLVDDVTGQPVLDGDGNAIETGLLRLELLDSPGTREHVPYCLPTAGNSAFVGCKPEIGALCLVGFMQQDKAVVIGFLPSGMAEVTRGRKTVPNIEAGEVFLQSGKADLDDNNDPNVFAGASLWLDRYGRIRMDARDYEFVAGYLLDGEFTPDAATIDDPVTGQQVFFRERMLGVERRVDANSNLVEAVGGDMTIQVDGTLTLEARGGLDLKSATGMQIADQKGSSVGVDADGNVVLNAAVSINAQAQGAAQISASGDVALMSQQDVRLVAGGQLRVIAAKGVDFLVVGSGNHVYLLGNKETIAAGGRTTNVAEGDFTARVLAGDIDLLALGKINLGNLLGAQNPVIAGDLLVAALQTFLAVLSAAPVAITTTPGNPAPASPALIAAAQALSAALPALLSKKVFISLI